MKTFFKTLANLVFVSLVGIGCAFVFSNKINEVKDNILGITAVQSNNQEEMITNQLKLICEMSSLEYDYKNSYVYTSEKQIKDWNLPFTKSKIAVIYDGKMKLGIDAKQMHVESEKDSKGNINKIVITLPEIKIISNEVDRESIEFPIEKNGFFNELSQKDYDTINNDLKTKIEEDLEDSSLKQIARDNLEKGIIDFFESIYGDSLTVEFKLL